MNHPLINLIKNKTIFDTLSNKYGTPTYLYDKKQLIKNITNINSALLNNFDNFQICYTIKANSNLSIIKTLKSTVSNLGADCSSPGEIFAATRRHLP